MKLWKSKKNNNNNNNNNTSSNSTISCVPGKSSTLVKDNDTKSDVATSSSTNVSGKLMICNPDKHQLQGINERTYGLTMAIQTKKKINYPFNQSQINSQPQMNAHQQCIWRIAAYSVTYNFDIIFFSSMKRPIDRKCFEFRTIFENRMKNKVVNLINERINWLNYERNRSRCDWPLKLVENWKQKWRWRNKAHK